MKEIKLATAVNFMGAEYDGFHNECQHQKALMVQVIR